MKLYIKSFIFSALLPVLFVSCLKDKDFDNGSVQSVASNGAQKIIEISLTSTSTDNHLQIAMNNSNNDTTFNLIPVTLASVNKAEEDINVTLVPNSSLIGNYNALNGTLHEAAPANVYTIVNPASSDATGYVVTIAKGTNVGFLKIKLKASNFIGHDYAFGFQISKIDKAAYLISTNLSSGVVAIGIKNKYDGVYTLDGTFNDVIAPSLNPTGPGDPYPYDVYLITASATSVVMFIPGAGYYHWIAGGSVYGEFCPIIAFDASDNVVAVTNFYGQPSPGRSRSAVIDPSGLNKFNADKSIDIKYIMKQSGVNRTFFNEHLTYKGPRP